MSQPHWKTVLATALCAAACSQPGLAQAVSASILQVDVENWVQYVDDVGDPSRFGTETNVTTPRQPGNFGQAVYIGDIVAVNGQPAKGTLSRVFRQLALTPSPNAGQAMADTTRNGVAADNFEILKSDGSPIGTIVLNGVGQGTPPLGGPLSLTSGTFAIVAGTGAFLGVRGQGAQATFAQRVPDRIASIAEDPANRRRYGGGRVRFGLQVIPMTVPQIVTTGGGPAVFHADFSPVTAAKPAKAGEVLIARAMGLGPTIPGLDPGQPFPTDAVQQVNSPLAVSVNGKLAEILNGIGWPGQVDTYRVDFHVPDGTTPGTAAIQLTAAWIARSTVGIPIQ